MSVKKILFSFQGRIRRKHFFLGILYALIVSFITMGAFATTFDMATNQPTTAGFVILAVYLVVAMWMSLALYIKRFHDRGKSGWWLLIGLVPLIGALWLFIELGFFSGEPKDNCYGQDPKNIAT